MSKVKANLSLRDNVELMFFSPSRSAGKGVSELMEMEPDDRITEHNVLTKEYRESLANALVPSNGKESLKASHIAFGDDNTTPSINDTHLKNEVFRKEVDEHTVEGSEFSCITLVTANEANGEDLLEWALVTEPKSSNTDDKAINRVVVDDPRVKPKTDEWAIAARISINYQDITEI